MFDLVIERALMMCRKRGARKRVKREVKIPFCSKCGKEIHEQSFYTDGKGNYLHYGCIESEEEWYHCSSAEL